mmetsp:Transcript_153428/g.490379  ORF Transcript_153428/g.490379 Transcript_153428/m.490379 type:complete len:968 (-) Transcript_153428:194-3097(-)
MITPQQRVVFGPVVFSSEFDSGNMGRVERSPVVTRLPGGTVKKEEYAITVAPDCVGTPGQNTNRTWFYFSVSFGEQRDSLAAVLPVAERSHGECRLAGPDAPVLGPDFVSGPTLSRPSSVAAWFEDSPASQALARPASAVSQRDRDDLSTSAEGDSGDEAGQPLQVLSVGDTSSMCGSNLHLQASSDEPGGFDDEQSVHGAASDVHLSLVASQPELDTIEPRHPQQQELPHLQDAQQQPSGVLSDPQLVAQPSDEIYGDTLSVRLSVCDMNNQSRIYRQGYRPWFRTPDNPQWRRMPDTADLGFSYEWGGEISDGGTGFSIRWKHRLRRDCNPTYFAFCAPYGYDDWVWLRQSLEVGFGEAAKPVDDHYNPMQCLSEAIQDNWLPKVGKGIYYHRQELGRSLEGRVVDILTITAASPKGGNVELEEALAGLDMPGTPPLSFPGRPIVFFSARVHPGETPGQYALLGALRHLLSDDPRAVAVREAFVFKLVPILNPDGVARGHYRTSSLGLNLNRFYDNPTVDQHECIWATKKMLSHWAGQKRLLLYVDFHSHVSRSGCFFLANRFKGDGQAWNVGFARLCQLNSPHFDLAGTEFSEFESTEKECKDGMDKRGSGRVSVYSDCLVCHSYTLECNYNKLADANPFYIPAKGLPTWTDGPGLRTKGYIAYDQGCWAQIGECLNVSLLDMYGHNCYSRISISKYTSLTRVVGVANLLKTKNPAVPGPNGQADKGPIPHVPPGQNFKGIKERECHCRSSHCCWSSSKSWGVSGSGESASRGSASNPPRSAGPQRAGSESPAGPRGQRVSAGLNSTGSHKPRKASIEPQLPLPRPAVSADIPLASACELLRPTADAPNASPASAEAAPPCSSTPVCAGSATFGLSSFAAVPRQAPASAGRQRQSARAASTDPGVRSGNSNARQASGRPSHSARAGSGSVGGRRNSNQARASGGSSSSAVAAKPPLNGCRRPSR